MTPIALVQHFEYPYSHHTPMTKQGLQQSAPAKLAALSFGLLITALLVMPCVGFSQTAKPAVAASAAASPTPAKLTPASAVKSATSRPAWVELTPMQQQSLKPLAPSWDTNISEAQKRKWLEISKNYASLPPDGQATMHSRMSEWIALSSEQRAQARLNFAKTKELSKQLTPEEKKAKWQTYQALSPEEKQKLAAKASPKPAGAATAVKPVSPQKLAAIPPNPNGKPATKAGPKITALTTSATPATAASTAIVDTPGATPQH